MTGKECIERIYSYVVAIASIIMEFEAENEYRPKPQVYIFTEYAKERLILERAKEKSEYAKEKSEYAKEKSEYAKERLILELAKEKPERAEESKKLEMIDNFRDSGNNKMPRHGGADKDGKPSK